MYVFDTSPLSSLFKNFYRSRFPTLWARFDVLIAEGRITSSREVQRELEQYAQADSTWMRDNRSIFTTPTKEEAEFILRIYQVRHFQHNIELKKLYKGGFNADPFVIAKAAVNQGTVVTLEKAQPKAAKIPNICTHFGVQCIDLEQFMEKEGWQF